jgi:hypothetical protein
MERADETAAYLVEALGQDDDAVLYGLVSRWPHASGDEIERALTAFAILTRIGERPSNENALAATD